MYGLHIGGGKISLPFHMEEESVFRIISYTLGRFCDIFISRKFNKLKKCKFSSLKVLRRNSDATKCLYDVCKLFYCIMKYLPMDTSRTPQNLSNLTQSGHCKICIS